MRHFIRTILYVLRKIIHGIFLFLFTQTAEAQNLTQNIRGTVLDKISQSPVQGAVVVLMGSDPVKGTSTDANGQFTLSNVPVGRQSIKVTYIGYKETVIPNITVNSGKEVVMNVQVEEDIVQAQEVVIKANTEKNKPINEMSTVSTRTFSVEETQKFAAAINDPARMATSFAGVVATNDGTNTISIRGNSPNGLLWRMEGVDIPNPNHFSSVATSGGGISILSAQLLSNSDFMTGAFASEYGNALAGVFDLKLRKGNSQKREYTFQASTLGIDAASEGPIKKGYGGSYLVNYRYSTLSMLGLMGVNVVGDAVITYQDLSFNVSLPAGKLGTFGIFGFGGLSAQERKSEKDSMAWREDSYKQYPSTYVANTGAIGINNTKLFGSKTFLKTSLLFAGTKNAFQEDKIDNNYRVARNAEETYIQGKVALSSTLTHKIDPRNSIRTGLIASYLTYDLFQRSVDDSLHIMETRINTKGQTSLLQTFVQWNHKLNTRLTTNLGMHFMYLALNSTYSVEPRASVKYELSSKQSLAFGYGLHGQIQPLGAYFATAPNSSDALNKNLKMSKAHHFVLSYDISIAPHTHIKTEAYYQYLFDIPVTTDPSKTFSMVNVEDGYNADPLTNKGLGRNYGLELTLERFLHRNFYYLLSVSLYESKYRASDNVWYNGHFNANYASTFTAGKEWQLSEKRKKKIIGVNTKLVYIGGFRTTPIDVARSVSSGETKYIESRAYELKNPDYFRIDIRVSLKRNFAHTTTTLSLDLQNATNHENINGQYFDRFTHTVKNNYQAGLIPVLAYRIEF